MVLIGRAIKDRLTKAKTREIQGGRAMIITTSGQIEGRNFVNKLVSILEDFVSGGVSELADEHDLGSCAARRGGSSPPFPTPRYKIWN